MPSGHPAKDGKGHLTSEPILKSKTLVILYPLVVRLAKLVLHPDGFVASCWSCNARPKPPQCGRKDRRLSAPPWRGFLADKSTHLMLNALSRAAAAPHGLPLFTAKTAPGLFPPTAIARVAAKRCKEDGLLRVLGDNEKPGRVGGLPSSRVVPPLERLASGFEHRRLSRRLAPTARTTSSLLASLDRAALRTARAAVRPAHRTRNRVLRQRPGKRRLALASQRLRLAAKRVYVTWRFLQMSSAVTSERTVAERALEVLRRTGNPFRNYFARNPDDEVCARYHVPELFAAERDLLLGVVDLYRFDPATHSEIIPVLGNKGAGKTHLLHSIKHGSGEWQLLVTPGVYQKDTDLLEYLLFQLIYTLIVRGKQQSIRP